jgi:two-component system chemotaxis response regulator CheY
MSIRVMIVDDSPAMRRFIDRTIQMSGLDVGECLQAADGRQALELLKASGVDIVLSDVNMPQMSGEEMLEVMRHDSSLRTTPVVVVSTDSTEARVSRMLRLGARGYIKKPFTPEILRTELERVLGACHA